MHAVPATQPLLSSATIYSVAPLSREKGRCDGGLHCAVRGTSPERTDHREKWSGAGKTETYHLCFLAKMMRIADSPRCCVRIFCFSCKKTNTDEKIEIRSIFNIL